MLKRLALIGFLTGIGQVFSIFSLKEIARTTDPLLFSELGKIDSLLLLLVNTIAFGLQSSAIRDIATSDNWQYQYQRIQKARFSLGLILMIGVLMSYWSRSNFVYLLAPLLALSGDYALYATGKSVAGSLIALLRIALPYFSTLLAALFYPQFILEVFILSQGITYLISNFIIALILKCPVFTWPSIKSLYLYIQNIPLGLVTISHYFLGLGLTLFVGYFYESHYAIVAFLGLKVYMIFKGVIRIIHQAYIKELADPVFCKKVDNLSSQLGLAFFLASALFPTTFIKTFIGSEFLDDKYFFVFLGLAGFVYSFFSSVTTKALLEKIDIVYAKISILSASIPVIGLCVFSFVNPTSTSISLSLLAGEILFSCLMVRALKNYYPIQDRVLEIWPAVVTLLIYAITRIFSGDTIRSLAITTIAFLLFFVWNQMYNSQQKIKSENPY